MGKVEKIAVLTVLFLIALILVVSMTTDNPLNKGKAALLGEQTSVSGLSPAGSSAPAAPEPGNKLLSATITPEPAAATAPPAAPPALVLPPNSLLKTTDGLSEGYDGQRLLYSWQSGDSYVGLAKKLYGEPTKFTLIQNANEGREDIQPGEKILVPIFDVENVVEADAHAAPKTAPKSKSAAEPVKKSAAFSPSGPGSGAGRTHTVKKGDSLWKIAKAELGDSARWNEIYELNKDKLKSPEALRDGMLLKLP
jgi:nucleoid-associated protein YgaU